MSNYENKKDKKKEFLLEEKTGLEAILEDLKLVTYNTLYVLLKKEEPESVYSLIYATFADYIQMLNFPFNQGIGLAWNADSFMNWLFNVFNFFQLTNYMPITYFMFVFSLYLVNAAILIVVIDIFYVSYKISKKKLTVTWPLDILRLLAQYFFTVLFLPITNTLVDIQKCSANSNGVLVLNNYDFTFMDVYCYRGWHIVHVVVCSFFNLVYIFFASLIAYTYFEPMMTVGDRKARQDSRGETTLIINKITGTLILTFFPLGDSTYYWWIIIFIFVPSIPLWWAYNIEDPYYDPYVARFYQIITTYYLWTTSNLFLCKLFGSSYTGGLIAWGIGLPFIILIMMYSNRNRINTLIKNQIKFTSGDQIQAHIKQVLQLIDYYKTDINSKILLIGYIEKHKEICLEEDCFLKMKKSKKKSKENQNEMEEACQNLIKELNRVYLNGVKKFPASTKLRISYAFFLTERMKRKDLAYEQFDIAGRTKPSFDQEFIIYRFKKMYEENQKNDNDGDDDDDIIQQIQFDSALQLCEEYMKRAIVMHKEFWQELKEENPSLTKLNIIGSKISQTVFQVKEQMNTMLKIKEDIPKILKIFGQFFIYVLNEKESGLELIKKAKEQIVVGKQKEKEGQEGNYNYKDNPIPYLLVNNGHKYEVGQIIDLNSLFSIHFGYQREELIGKQVETIIPQLISQYHQQIMITYYENIQLGQIESNYINEPQQRFGKNRNGYIFPIQYKVIPLNDEISRYVVEFQSSQVKKSTAVIFTDEEGTIKDITPFCIFLFGLDSSTIKKQKSKIETIIPDWRNIQNYNQRKGKEICYSVKQIDGTTIQNYSNCQITQIVITMSVSDEEDEDILIQKPQLIGYCFRFEKIEKNEKSTYNTSKHSQRHNNSDYKSVHDDLINQNKLDDIQTLNASINSPLIKQTFSTPNQFSNIFDQNLNQQAQVHKDEIREQNEQNSTDVLVTNTQFKSIQLNQHLVGGKSDNLNTYRISNISKMIVDLMKPPQLNDFEFDEDDFNQDENEIEITNRINYGLGIKTRRWFNNKFEFLGDKNSSDEEDEEEEDLENSVFANQFADKFENVEDEHIFNQKNSFQTIKQALSSDYQHMSIKCFGFVSFFWISILFALSIYQYTLSSNLISGYYNNLVGIKYFNDRLFSINNIVSKTFDLVNLNTYPEMVSQLNQTEIILEMQNSINNIISLTMNISDSGYSFFEQQQFDEPLEIQIFYSQSDTLIKNQSVTNAIFTINSLAQQLSQGQLSLISLNNPNFYTIIYNFFNIIYFNQRTFSQQIYQQISNQINSVDIVMIIIVAVTFIITSISIYLFIIFTIVIKEQKEMVLFFFLEIPINNINYFYKHCEKFMDTFSSLRDVMNEKDNAKDDSSDDDEEENILQQNKNGLEEDEDEMQTTREVSQYNSTDNLDQNSATSAKSNEQQLQEELMKKRQKIIKKYKKRKFRGQTVLIARYIFVLVLSLLFSIINYVNLLQQKAQIQFVWPQFYSDTSLQSTIAYYINVQKMMYVQPDFPILRYTAESSSLQQLQSLLGTRTGLVNFNKGLQSQSVAFQNNYYNVYYGSVCTFFTNPNYSSCNTTVDQNFQLGLFTVVQAYFNILKTNLINYQQGIQSAADITHRQIFIDADSSLYIYFQPLQNWFLQYEMSYCQSQFTSSTYIQSILLAVFLICLFLSFLFLILPTLNQKSIEINRTIQMLNMIPFKVIKENISIRRFLRNLIKQQDKTKV
ncbi:hypothetical protein ABPG74_006095 [Tetrahymena malaccensis]